MEKYGDQLAFYPWSLIAMNIVLFTPVNATSTIALSSCAIVEAFVGAGHTVHVVASEFPDIFSQPQHAFAAPVVYWNNTETVSTLLQQAEAVFYQIGDNFSFQQYSKCSSFLQLRVFHKDFSFIIIFHYSFY